MQPLKTILLRTGKLKVVKSQDSREMSLGEDGFSKDSHSLFYMESDTHRDFGEDLSASRRRGLGGGKANGGWDHTAISRSCLGAESSLYALNARL